MVIVISLIVIAALVFGPGIWVQRVLARYSQPAERYDATGAEIARRLLDEHGLTAVRVERTESGDHYDPDDKAVRLSPDKFDGRSLTAITVAAHEVGHAVQDFRRFAPLHWRTRLVKATRGIERVGAGVLVVAPFLGLLTRVPARLFEMHKNDFWPSLPVTVYHATVVPLYDRIPVQTPDDSPRASA